MNDCEALPAHIYQLIFSSYAFHLAKSASGLTNAWLGTLSVVS